VIEEAQRQVPEIVPRSSAIINGLAVPDLAPAPLPFDPPTLLCLGRLARQKGFDLALLALRSLVARVPGIRMVVAGDGPLRADLERLAAGLELGSAVRFTGWVEPQEVPALLNTATIVVMPSWNEGLPLVAIQAAQMGRPIVATRVSGNPEVVDDGNTGLLIEPGDPGALADAIVSLLGDPAAAERMGAAARRRALELFTLDRCADEYFALYRQLVQH
jgi:glycogen(starch) synthase